MALCVCIPTFNIFDKSSTVLIVHIFDIITYSCLFLILSYFITLSCPLDSNSHPEVLFFRPRVYLVIKRSP